MGMYFGQGVYLQSSWNILDGLLVFVSLVDILVSIASASGNRILGILRVLRLLRTLRPLRYEDRRFSLMFTPLLLSCVFTWHDCNLTCVSQGDKSSSWSKTGGGDSDHISQTHWEYCPHLLCFFHRVWNSWSPGKHLHCLFPVHRLLAEDKPC